MADEKQEYEVYVKLGRRGLIERTPASPRELVNMKGTGWARKGSKNAPSDEQVAEVEKRAEEEDARRADRISPTSAVAAAANPDLVNAVPAGADTSTADAKPKKAAPAKAAEKADA